MIFSDEFINKIFKGKNFVTIIRGDVSKKRAMLERAIIHQEQGRWSSEVIYLIMINYGFIIDGKKEENKKLTGLGVAFLQSQRVHESLCNKNSINLTLDRKIMKQFNEKNKLKNVLAAFFSVFGFIGLLIVYAYTVAFQYAFVDKKRQVAVFSKDSWRFLDIYPNWFCWTMCNVEMNVLGHLSVMRANLDTEYCGQEEH